MKLFDLGFTKAYQQLACTLNKQFHSRKNAAIERAKERRAAEQRNATLALLMDDAHFHKIPLASLLPSEDEQYEAEFGFEDW